MDQKRLFIAIAISVAILLVFQVLIAPHLPPAPKPPPQQVASHETSAAPTPLTPSQGSPAPAAMSASPRFRASGAPTTISRPPGLSWSFFASAAVSLI